MHDHPERSIEEIRGILEQIVKGLRAFHRREMLHQDLRPENIMIDAGGTVKLIDFGSAYVAGVQETGPLDDGDDILGTAQYTAPEYFSNEPVSWRSDLFSLGVIAYELLTGGLPYGTQVAKVRTPGERLKLHYKKAQHPSRPVPDWLDDTIRRAVHPTPESRHDALSAFETGLRTPSLTYRRRNQGSLLERDPERFWRTTAAVLALLCAALAVKAFGGP